MELSKGVAQHTDPRDDLSRYSSKISEIALTCFDDDITEAGDLHSSVETAMKQAKLSLPPVDSGWNAILTVICGFLIEGVTYGLPYTYSIFQNFYRTQPEFKDASVTALALVGTLNVGLTYIGGLFVALLETCLSLKTIMYIGSVIIVVGFIGASFATATWHLVLAQGVTLGIGSGFLYNAFFPFVPMWWFKYRGLATGIIFTGGGVVGLVAPVAIENGLHTIGFRWTLRIIAAISLVCCLGSSIVLRSRYLPDAANKNRTSFSTSDFRFFSSQKFILLGLSTLMQGLSFFIPNLFVQYYALSVGLPHQLSTTLVSVLNAVAIFGQLLLGYVSDRYGYLKAMVISSYIASLSTFFLWRFAGSSFAMLTVYVVIYGIFGGGFTTCYPSMIMDVTEKPNQFVLVSGAFMVIRGVGSMVGNPIGSIFLEESTSGTRGWNEMIYYAGSCLLASAIVATIQGLLRTRKQA